MPRETRRQSPFAMRPLLAESGPSSLGLFRYLKRVVNLDP